MDQGRRAFREASLGRVTPVSYPRSFLLMRDVEKAIQRAIVIPVS
jgi:hypothetical protein